MKSSKIPVNMPKSSVLLRVPNVYARKAQTAQNPGDILGGILLKLDRAKKAEIGEDSKSRLRQMHGVDGTPSEVTAVLKTTTEFDIIGLANVFHPQALMILFQTINACIKLSKGQEIKGKNIHATKLTSSEIEASYKLILDIWKKEGRFLGEKELLKRITEDLGLKINPQIFATELSSHGLTGLPSKFNAPIKIALAHAYALSTGKPMSLMFGDVANVGGTNCFFERLLLADIMNNSTNGEIGFTNELWNKLGITNEELAKVETELVNFRATRLNRIINLTDIERITKLIREKAANSLTDWTTRAMMHRVDIAFKETLPGIGEQIQKSGYGGDETIFTIPTDENRVRETVVSAMEGIHEFINEMGLGFHEHLKGKSAGLGLGLFLRSLNTPELNLTDITQKDSGDKAKVPAMFDQGKNYAADVSRLARIIDKLTLKYSEFNPQQTAIAAEHQVLGKFDPGQQNNPDYLIEYQLHSVFNHASGVPDVAALAQSFIPRKHHGLMGIDLMNLSAINDILGQEVADHYQREFTQALYQIQELKNAEIFSAGPGKFYLLLDQIANKELVEDRINKLILDFNQEVHTEAGQSYKIGDLVNSKNNNLKGLHCTVIQSGISSDLEFPTPIHEALSHVKSSLQQTSGVYVASLTAAA